MERAQSAIHLKKKKKRERTKLIKERERERKERKKTLNQSSASFVERNRWLSAVRHSQTFPLVIEQ